MCLQCCYCCHLKLVWDRMVPSCVQRHEHDAAAGGEARQLTLEEILYPPPSWEMDAAGGGTPARRSSPKVCPVSLGFSSSDDDDEDSDNGGSPAVGESVSIVSRASLRSQSSVSRRVSFRSPDASDIFIIPATSYSDDNDEEEEEEESSDGDTSGGFARRS